MAKLVSSVKASFLTLGGVALPWLVGSGISWASGAPEFEIFATGAGTAAGASVIGGIFAFIHEVCRKDSCRSEFYADKKGLTCVTLAAAVGGFSGYISVQEMLAKYKAKTTFNQVSTPASQKMAEDYNAIKNNGYVIDLQKASFLKFSKS